MTANDELHAAGVPVHIELTPSQSYIEVLRTLGYSFALNLADQSVEVNGAKLNDITAAVIRTQMRDRGVKNMSAVEDAYLGEAQRNAYHPIKNYLNGLKWDGGDHISELCNSITSDSGAVDYRDGNPPTPLHAVYIYRWSIGAVAKVMQPLVQNPVLVWDSAQGLGKSRLARWLCPLTNYFIEGPIVVGDKDSELRLMSKWIWEVSELDATTRKADVSALKGFIFRDIVTVRRAYGRHDTVGQAMTSFIGTVNNSTGFLADETGSRRFYIVKLTHIDWQRYTQIDINQYWAQAMHLYLNGEPWELTPEELAAQRSVNAQYEVETPIEDWMRQYFTFTGDEADMLTAGEIINHLRSRGIDLSGSERAQAMELARVLPRLGATHTLRRYAGKPARVWVGIIINHASGV